jgi:hypothetical protein
MSKGTNCRELNLATGLKRMGTQRVADLKLSVNEGLGVGSPRFSMNDKCMTLKVSISCMYRTRTCFCRRDSKKTGLEET